MHIHTQREVYKLGGPDVTADQFKSSLEQFLSQLAQGSLAPSGECHQLACLECKGGGGYPFASIAKRNRQSSESGITVCMYIYMYVAVTLMIGEQVSGMWQANIWLATRVLFAMRMV